MIRPTLYDVKFEYLNQLIAHYQLSQEHPLAGTPQIEFWEML